MTSEEFTTASAGVAAQQPKPDNTTVNKGDRAPDAVTADQQKNSKADLAVAIAGAGHVKNDITVAPAQSAGAATHNQ